VLTLLCVQFRHFPNNVIQDPRDNERYQTLEFVLDDKEGRVDKDGITIHGLAGYFQCDLFEDIGFSTVPETFSEGMFSWFPMYIPIEVPLFVPHGWKVGAHVWRRVSSAKIWYEWSVSTYPAYANESGKSLTNVSGQIHNVNGLHSFVAL
jgi:protein arginine N-methyltransferase 5